MLEVTINDYTIQVGDRFAVTFQRTLRIPDDGRTYPLPPGLGAFPILKVEDYADRLPAAWREQGGAFIPMCQREALWLGFEAAFWKPNAVKVAIGRVSAISGEPDDRGLHADPQDYVVCPDQPWLDGINSGHGSIRQFVAMPLGLGYSVEAAITGEEKFGGIQITVFEPKPGKFPDQAPAPSLLGRMPFSAPMALAGMGAVAAQPMGLGAGGVMKQKIYPDPHGIDTWDQGNYGRVAIHIVNSAQFLEITGHEPPPTPVDAKTYTEYGFPWFDLYDEASEDVTPSERLAKARTIAARDAELGEPGADDASVDVRESQVRKLDKESSRTMDQSSSPGQRNEDEPA